MLIREKYSLDFSLNRLASKNVHYGLEEGTKNHQPSNFAKPSRAGV